MLTLNRVPKTPEPPKPVEAQSPPTSDALATTDFGTLLDQRREMQAEKSQSREEKEKAETDREDAESEEEGLKVDASVLLAMTLLVKPTPLPQPPDTSTLKGGETDALLTATDQTKPSPEPQSKDATKQNTKGAITLEGWIAVPQQAVPLSPQKLNEALAKPTALPSPFTNLLQATPASPSIMPDQAVASAMSKEPFESLFSVFTPIKEGVALNEKPSLSNFAPHAIPHSSTLSEGEAQAFEGSREGSQQEQDAIVESNSSQTKHATEKPEAVSDSFTSLEQRALAEKPASVLATQPDRTALLDRSEVVDQVTKHLENMRLQNGKGEMAFQLRPDHLGDIRIHISSDREGVIARILTENHPVQQALEGAKETLRQSLEQRGLLLVRFDVALAQGGMTDRQYASPNPQAPLQTRPQGRSASRIAPLQGVTVSTSRDKTPLLRGERLSRLDYSA